MEKPSVFISYNHSSAAFVMEIVKRLEGIADVHWDRNIGPWESFTAFMNTIRKQDYVVLIISDLYLKSAACLYEVTELMDVENWDKKTLFIVEENARKIFKPNNWFEYISYWDCKLGEFKENYATYSDIEALQIELAKLEKIKNQIIPFLQIVADTNIPDIWRAIDDIVERLKISGKKNSAQEIERVIIKLIESGLNTTTDLMIATNRSRSSIEHYIVKLRKDGIIGVNGNGRTREYYKIDL